MSGVSHREVANDEGGMRLDRWFKEHYPELAFGALNRLLRKGSVRVDGSRVKANARLVAGQKVRVPPIRIEARPGEERVIPQAPKALDDFKKITLFEDDMVLVLNKPAGLAVQGGSGINRHLDGMLEALRDRQGRKPRLVHRLDRETSGVIVVAKTKAAASALAGSFRARSTKKVYWALVRGVPKPAQGRLSTYLQKGQEINDSGQERVAVLRDKAATADHAVTLYSTVENSGQKLAWLTLRPITGRTHQLRAHCNHMGHPIIGDPKYFDVENWQLPGGIQNRLHLHARRLIIPHPKSGTIDVTAPLPPHMQQSWNLLGLDLGEAAQDVDWDVLDRAKR